MDMGSSDMDMGSHACKISMLWNWNTVDSCFLSASWHVRSKGMFAGTIIGVFILCNAIEFVRRVGREYDRRLIMAAKSQFTSTTLPEAPHNKDSQAPALPYHYRPSWIQQIIRGVAYGSQFSAAFFVMLLGMYYNGYMLFAIFLGQTTGYILFGRDTCTASIDHVASGSCC
ncbi:uncharacterized protein IL334_006870 [Kwoniella shivajii]|uniref:Copper transport protein n=1 Tax=Kwoniella shivajii TaxID=564305 RepID=A0ABZ1D759_9TREE|nr:hypothetical protein IL334_006870 [Kwoniella shivajii]